MKAAVIRARRRLADGRRMLQVVCPLCEHRHWMPEAPVGFGGRRQAGFPIAIEAGEQ